MPPDAADLVAPRASPAATTVILLEANVSIEMAERAAAVPLGWAAEALDWRDQREHQIEVTKRWRSWCSDQGVDAPSVVRVGCVWSFGGRREGRGRYLRDAYLYAVVDSAGLGQRFDCTGGFSTPPLDAGAGVARLLAEVELVWHQFGRHAGTWHFELDVHGDGTGWVREG